MRNESCLKVYLLILFAFFSPFVKAATNQPLASVLIYDQGIYPVIANREISKSVEENRRKILEMYKRAKSENEKKYILGAGFHGTWVAQELLKGLDQKLIGAKSLSTQSSADVLMKVLSGAVKVQNPDESSIKAYIKKLVNGYRVDFNNAQPIDLVNLSIGYEYQGKTEALRKFERNLFEKEFNALFKEFPKTLFVISAGNDNLDVGKLNSTYNFSGIQSENVVLVGSENNVGQKSKFSNFGKDVDVYVSGENVNISLRNFFKFPWLHKNDKFIIEGTSFAAPRLGNLILADLIETRKTNPTYSPLEAFRKILRNSRPFSELKNHTAS